MSSPTYQFDDAIEVGRAERLTEGNRDVRRYHVEIKQNYVAAGAPFGGIILATVLNSLSRDFADPGNDAQPTKDKKVRWPHPLGCQATFLNIGKVGPAYVDVRRLKEGGRSAVAEAVLRQDQETKKGGFETMDILCVVATYGDLSAEEGPDYLSEKRPEIEFDEKNLEWKPTKEQPGIGFQGLVERVTVLPTLQPSQPSNNPPPVVFHASRFADGRPNDVISLGFWCDMFNSPVRRIPELQKMGFRGMTMDLSVQFRALPRGRIIYTRVWTRHLTRGRYDCTCELWDESGSLVCIATQTRMMRGLTGGWKAMAPKGSHKLFEEGGKRSSKL